MVLTPTRTAVPATNPHIAKPRAPIALRQSPMAEHEQWVGRIQWSRQSVEDGTFRQQATLLAHRGRRRMQLWLPGKDSDDSASLTPTAVRALGVLYDTFAELAPRAHLVPLLRCAGWTEESVSALPGMNHVTSKHTQPSDYLYTQEHTQPVSPGAEHERVLYPEIRLNLGSPSEVLLPSDGEQGANSAATQVPLSFDHVAVGGTFDRLHCGHELLLASTALVSRKTVYVGITADKLLANKNHRELLQPYNERCSAAVDFLQAVNPHIRVEAGALTDPNEPTQAELDPAMQALVVSQETLPGAVKINQGRVARGFKPLLVLVVPVIGIRRGAKDASSKLSSSQLRAEDAAADKA